jgi:hypothetical protein
MTNENDLIRLDAVLAACRNSNGDYDRAVEAILALPAVAASQPFDDMARVADDWMHKYEEANKERDDAMALFHAADKAHKSAKSELRNVEFGLADPVAVHANMLRGTIAKPTVSQIIHLYGADAIRAALPADPVRVVVKPQNGNWQELRDEIAKMGDMPNGTDFHISAEACGVAIFDLERFSKRGFQAPKLLPEGEGGISFVWRTSNFNIHYVINGDDAPYFDVLPAIDVQPAPRDAQIAALVEAAERSAEGWGNAIELDIILPQHRTAAGVLRDDLRAAIAAVKGGDA